MMLSNHSAIYCANIKSMISIGSFLTKKSIVGYFTNIHTYDFAVRSNSYAFYGVKGNGGNNLGI